MSGYQRGVRHHRFTARDAAVVLILTAALIGFGVAFPPWGYVSVAAVWVVVLIWRLASNQNDTERE
jgi:hypothetical protein